METSKIVISEMVSEMKHLRDRVDILETDNRKCQDMIVSLKKELKDCHVRIYCLEDDLSAKQLQYDECKSNLEDLINKYSELNVIYSENKADLSEKLSVNKLLSIDLESTRSRYEISISKFQQSLEERTQRIELLERENIKFANYIKLLEDQNVVFRSQLKEWNNKTARSNVESQTRLQCFDNLFLATSHLLIYSKTSESEHLKKFLALLDSETRQTENLDSFGRNYLEFLMNLKDLSLCFEDLWKRNSQSQENNRHLLSIMSTYDSCFSFLDGIS